MYTTTGATGKTSPGKAVASIQYGNQEPKIEYIIVFIVQNSKSLNTM